MAIKKSNQDPLLLLGKRTHYQLSPQGQLGFSAYLNLTGKIGTMRRIWFLFFCLVFVIPSISFSQGKTILGFKVEDPLIPFQEIKHGGPSKDGIPSIDQPNFSEASSYDYFPDEERVLGVFHNGIAKAYPIGILNWHEIVNDKFGKEKVVITYCPLCGSGISFKSSIQGKDLEFGVSGLLYNSDVLLYDRGEESLWSQILMKAISGPYKGQELEMLHTANTTLGEWKNQYPNTLVLNHNTGFSRNYLKSPYGDYDSNTKLFFPVADTSSRYHLKELVLGLSRNGKFRAYPFKELKKLKNGIGIDKWKGDIFEVHYNREAESAKILDSNGDIIPTVTLFWFAWYGFHPNTSVFKARSKAVRKE